MENVFWERIEFKRVCQNDESLRCLKLKNLELHPF